MIMIDLENSILSVKDGKEDRDYELGSSEAFSIISKIWLRSGWEAKYVYSFSWMGRPIIQLPEDMIRIQEVVFSVRPDVIIETGVAHGGSLVFYASLCKAMDKGRIIGVDIEIRSHNRKAIEGHPLYGLVTLVEGNSIDTAVLEKVQGLISPGETVLVILDSGHTKDHVLGELRAYSPLVTLGSYIVVADGIMEQLVGAARTQPDWIWNNPRQAAIDFVKENQRFAMEEPQFPFNEGSISERVTYWVNGYLKRIG